MLAPHLVARLRSSSGARRFRAGDASPWVRTTLRKPVQERVAEIVGRHRRVLAENGVWNAAALVLDVPTGEVLAYVGNQWPPRARTSTASTWTWSPRPAARAAS